MTTRRNFLKGAAALAAVGVIPGPCEPEPVAELAWHVTDREDDMAYVYAHASWENDPMRGPKEWAGGMTVVDSPEAIAWAKERLGSMLKAAYHTT